MTQDQIREKLALCHDSENLLNAKMGRNNAKIKNLQDQNKKLARQISKNMRYRNQLIEKLKLMTDEQFKEIKGKVEDIQQRLSYIVVYVFITLIMCFIGMFRSYAQSLKQDTSWVETETDTSWGYIPRPGLNENLIYTTAFRTHVKTIYYRALRPLKPRPLYAYDNTEYAINEKEKYFIKSGKTNSEIPVSEVSSFIEMSKSKKHSTRKVP